MYRSFWIVVRFAIIVLLLGQAFSPVMGQAGSAAPLAAPQQKTGAQAFSPLATGALPMALHYVRTFGQTGMPYPPTGQDAYLNNPGGLTLGPTGIVYVVESQGRRLRSYTAPLTPGFTVGTAGQDKEFSNPQDVALYNGNLWIADSWRILIYNTSGAFVQEIGNFDNSVVPNSRNNFDCANGLSFDKSGRLYVAQSCGSNNLAIFTITGTPGTDAALTLQSLIQPGFNNPQAVQVANLDGTGDEEVYVADNSQLWRCLESGGWACTPFANNFQPRGMGLNPNDLSHLYVVHNDWNGQGVMACDAGGSCDNYISNPNNAPQILNDPVDVAFDAAGNAYVTDRGDSTIKKFTTPTTFSVFAGTQGVPYATPSTPSPNYFYNNPGGIAIGADFSVFILEEAGARLTKLSDTGAFAWKFGVPGVQGNDSLHLNWPSGNPAIDSSGRIYVPDRNNQRVVILDPSDGHLLASISNKDDPILQFNSPAGVAIGPNGDIYVVDQDANNIQIYNSDRFYLTSIGVKWEWGQDNAHFNRPMGIAVKDDKTIFVADRDNNRVQQCTRPTVSDTTWTCTTILGVTGQNYWDTDHFDRPSSVAWDGLYGRLYVLDQNQNRVMVFDGAGKLLTVLGTSNQGSGNAQLSNPRSLAVDAVGNLYVADQNNQRVQKFIPFVPTVEFAGQIGGPVHQVVKSGSTLYASAGPRLVAYSLADANHPALLGKSDLLPREINNLAVSGSNAYVTLSDSGFYILNLSAPSHPTISGSLPIINATAVAVQGSRAYVTARCCAWNWPSARLYVIDITNKASPQVVNYLDWPDPNSLYNLDAVAVSGTGDGQFAYLADENQGLVKVSVAGVTPTTPPSETGRYAPPGISATGVALNDAESLAYLVDQNFGLRIVHTAGGMDDSGLGSVQTQSGPDNWSPVNISRDGNTLYLSANYQGLGMIDVTDPVNPTQIFHQGMFGIVENVVSSGGLIYAARRDDGLQTFQYVTTPNPGYNVIDTQLQPAGDAGTAVAVGNTTYETSGFGGLRILDTHNPVAPVELSASNLDTSINNLAVLVPQPGSNTYAYLVTGQPGDEGLRIVKVTDPTKPVLTGKTTTLHGQLGAVGVRQAASGAPVYAYVFASAWWDNNASTFGDGSLRVVDVTNPSNIGETIGPIPGLKITGGVNTVAFYGHYLLAAESRQYDNKNNYYKEGGLHVFDLTDPANPVEKLFINKFNAASLAVLGNRLYMTLWGDGLNVWDISNADPNQWTMLGSYPSSNDNFCKLTVQTVGGRTYVTTGRGTVGMGVYDVTDPAKIQMVEETGRLPGWGWSPIQMGNYVLFSSPGGGMDTFWSVPSAEGVILHGAGGSLVSAADSTTYTFGAGALAADVRLLHVPVLPANIPAINTPPNTARLGIGRAFVISTTDAAEDRPLTTMPAGKNYTLTVQYSAAEVASLTEASLSLYYYDTTAGAWVKEPTTVNTFTHTLTATPNHFSLWTVLGWLDNTAPTGTLTINSGSTYTAQPGVTLNLTYTSDTEQVHFKENCTACGWGPWQFVTPGSTSANFNFTLTNGDGLKRVDVELKNHGGNINAAPIYDEITLDTTPPGGSISIVETNPTRISPLHLNVSATDTLSGMGGIRFSEQASFADNPGWLPYAVSATFTPSAGDGLKTIYAQFKDVLGNVTVSIISASITLDQTAPTGVLYINGGAAVTTTSTVTLTLAASDNLSGPAKMRFNTTGAFTTETWVPYSAVSPFTLPAGDGTKTVYAQVQDAAGNVSALPIQATIVLDSTSPAGSLTINLKPFAASTSVSLTLTGGDATTMRLSNSSSFPGADATWMAFAATKPWTLSGSDGPKTVYVQFQDSHGNSSAIFSDSTLLDTTAPVGQLYINGNAPVTALPAVKLFNTFTETGSGVSSYKVADTSAGLASASWLTFVNPADYTLPGADGTKTVWIQLKDAAGNISAAYSDTITLDHTAPSGSVVINAGATSTTSNLVTLTLSATDLISPAAQLQMQVSNSSSFTGAVWQPYQTSLPWTMLAGSGAHTVYACFRDAAGNVSATASDDIQMGAKVYLSLIQK